MPQKLTHKILCPVCLREKSSTFSLCRIYVIFCSSPSRTSFFFIPQSDLTFEQLEEKINKWVHELSHQEELFLDQATKINAWGLLVNDNLDKLTNLDDNVKAVERDQKNIDRELDLVISMQQELKEMIARQKKVKKWRVSK